MAFLNMNREGMGLMLLGLSCMALVAAVGAFMYSFSFVRTASRADGKVVRLEKDESNPDSSHTVFTFRDSQGNEHTVRSSLASSPPEYKVGDSVVVLYDAGSPGDARVRNFFSIWGAGFHYCIAWPAGAPARYRFPEVAVPGRQIQKKAPDGPGGCKSLSDTVRVIRVDGRHVGLMTIAEAQTLTARQQAAPAYASLNAKP